MGSSVSNATTDLARIADHVKTAQAAFDKGNDEGTIAPLTAGLAAVRALRAKLSALDPSARYELDFRLAQKERQFADALVLAQPLRIEVLADDGVVVPGQAVKVTVIVGNRGATPVEIRGFRFSGFDGAACQPPTSALTGVHTCATGAKVPLDATPTGVHWNRRADADRYDLEPDVPFGAPFAPTPFRASLTLAIGGAEVSIDRPVEYRYEGDIFSGEKRMELKVVPAFGIAVDPGDRDRRPRPDRAGPRGEGHGDEPRQRTRVERGRAAGARRLEDHARAGACLVHAGG